MDKYLVSLFVFIIFISGWIISYIAARLLFNRNGKKMARLEERIRSEDVNAVVIRRKSVSILYMIWGVHFIWLVLTITFCGFAINGPDDTDFDGAMRISLDVAGAFTLMSIGCSLLATAEYGFTVSVINDQGIKQLRRGFFGYRQKDSMAWSDIEEIKMEIDELPRLFLRGQGKNLAVFADCANFDKLRNMLIGKVPKEKFDSTTNSGCSTWFA